MLLSAHPELRPLRVHAFGATLGLVAGVDFVAAILIAMAGTQVQHGLGVAPRDFLWALTSYAVAAVMANLMLVQLAGRVNYRRFTLASLTVFIAGALGCAAASSLPAFTAARLVQGLGGGGLFAAARILAQYSSQPQERLSLFWGFGVANFALVALAPWLAGWLVAHHGWHTLFLLQAGLALPLLPLVAWLYPRVERTPSRALGRLDWPGVLAFAGGALLLVHALEHLRYLSRAELPQLAAYALLGLVLLGVVMRRFARHPDPWLDPRRLASRRYLAGLAFYGVFYLICGYWNFLVPAVLVDGLGFGLDTVGGLLALGGLTTLGAVVVFHLCLPYIMRKRRYIALGYVGLAAAFTLMAVSARPGAGVLDVLPPIVLQGAMPVLALLQVAMMTFVDMPTEDFAHAYAFKNIVREILNALGTGLAVLQLHHGTAAAQAAMQAATPGPLQPHLAEVVHRAAVGTAAGQMLSGLALACLLVAAVAVWQRALR
ncbi:multidrug resistance transmembrane protein [Azoarcus olearius]|uniref:MFS transporter n=1 Tax=Azoarcus sp. (strain BH72) TaxID=418699 RepID=UPI0008063F97|nr:MFS transporter [Azoarcus olearius]ANQ83723.1 multidrug resistance transmembrane protein [Azoarcus olearius]